MGLRDWFQRVLNPEAFDPEPQQLLRDIYPLSMGEFQSYFMTGGNVYPLGIGQSLSGTKEKVGPDFQSLASLAYKQNGVVFACMVVRLMAFTEARFMFRKLNEYRPGDLFGDSALDPLYRPWVGGTTGDLLAKCIQDVDLAGNAFVKRSGPQGKQLKRLRPDWMTIVSGTPNESDYGMWDPDAEILGYLYQPGGPGSHNKPIPMLPDQVMHFAPQPDPTSPWRGMSWLTPVLTEITADAQMTDHKSRFLENGATVNLVVTLDKGINREQFNNWISTFEEGHEGVANAYKTLYLGAGADVKALGSNMQEIDFAIVQGAGETRIAAAANVPPVIIGLSEGLKAATYSNYGQARRRFADICIRPLWRNFAGSMGRIITAPPDSELWYDERDIAFLREDQTDEAAIQSTLAGVIRYLVDSGFEPDAVIEAVTSNDFTKLLKKHTGWFSVQLQPGPPNGPDANDPQAPIKGLANAIAPFLPKAQPLPNGGVPKKEPVP